MSWSGGCDLDSGVKWRMEFGGFNDTELQLMTRAE